MLVFLGSQVSVLKSSLNDSIPLLSPISPKVKHPYDKGILARKGIDY